MNGQNVSEAVSFYIAVGRTSIQHAEYLYYLLSAKRSDAKQAFYLLLELLPTILELPVYLDRISLWMWSGNKVISKEFKTMPWRFF